MMDWTTILNEQELLVWQGRPAPRCFTFRRWPQALFGAVVLVIALWWQWASLSLVREQGQVIWGWIPLPFVLIGCYLAIGQLLVARWEWRRVFFAVSDQRLLIQCGVWRRRLISIPLTQLSYLRVDPVGERLGHLAVEAGQRRVTLCCLEEPQRPFELLRPYVEAVQLAESSGEQGA